MSRLHLLSTTPATLPAFLLPLEVVQTSSPSVGLYFGRSKSPFHQDGTIHLTTHRLIFVSSDQPLERSGYINLSEVREISYYARFLKSSPKIVIEFRNRGAKGWEEEGEDEDEQGPGEPNRVDAPVAVTAPTTSTWVCTICGFSNSLNAASTPNCQLCGVARKAGSEPSSSVPTPSGGRSPRGAGGATLTSAPPAHSQARSSGMTCPVCTFDNHPSMSRCEMCDADLGTLQIRNTSASSRSKGPGGGGSVVDSLEPPSRTANSSQTSLPLSSSRPNTSGDGTPNGTSGAHAEVAEGMKLSFRKGGDKAFYTALKASLRDKAWKVRGGNGSAKGKMGSATSNGTTQRKVGIDGIISAVDGQAKHERQDMDDALQDLEALMGKAKGMVELAESLNAKLAKQEASSTSSTTDSEAATAIRSSLLQLGLPSPAVTLDMARNEASYHRQLARELAGVLLVGRDGKGGIMGEGSVGEGLSNGAKHDRFGDFGTEKGGKGRGIMGLDEVWCAWNRARGVALVPPQALRSAAVHLQDLTKPPIKVRTLRSGLVVLHTPRYEPLVFARRVLDLLEQRRRMGRPVVAQSDGRGSQEDGEATGMAMWYGEGLQTSEVARMEGANPLLTTELMDDVEEMGAVVRDEGAPDGAVRWFPNLFEQTSLRDVVA